MPQANATYSVKHWDRKRWDGERTDEGKTISLSRAEMTHIFKGDIEGEGTIQFLFGYTEDNRGGFVALEQVTGSVRGKSGSFVLQFMGTAANDRLKQTLVVVPTLGTGDLKTLRGQATMDCNLHMDAYAFTLEYEL